MVGRRCGTRRRALRKPPQRNAPPRPARRSGSISAHSATAGTWAAGAGETSTEKGSGSRTSVGAVRFNGGVHARSHHPERGSSAGTCARTHGQAFVLTGDLA